MASEKDNCFAEAIDAYKELREEAGAPLNVEITHQTPWVRDPLALNSQWAPVKHIFNKWYHIYGYAKRKFGFGTTQVRYPDVTVKLQNGSHLVLDNKFTDKNGKIDSWRDKPNEYSGTTQREDYEQINRQQGNDVGEPSLDKDKCQCDERKKKRQLQEQTVLVPDPALQLDPFLTPLPGRLPNPGGLPAPRPPVIRPGPIIIRPLPIPL